MAYTEEELKKELESKEYAWVLYRHRVGYLSNRS